MYCSLMCGHRRTGMGANFSFQKEEDRKCTEKFLEKCLIMSMITSAGREWDQHPPAFTGDLNQNQSWTFSREHRYLPTTTPCTNSFASSFLFFFPPSWKCAYVTTILRFSRLDSLQTILLHPPHICREAGSIFYSAWPSRLKSAFLLRFFASDSSDSNADINTYANAISGDIAKISLAPLMAYSNGVHGSSLDAGILLQG